MCACVGSSSALLCSFYANMCTVIDDKSGRSGVLRGRAKKQRCDRIEEGADRGVSTIMRMKLMFVASEFFTV